LTCKTVSQITYTVLVETLNTAQLINQSCDTCEGLHGEQSRQGDKAGEDDSEDSWSETPWLWDSCGRRHWSDCE